MDIYSKWARYALLNLLIVSGIGVLLRYKILFALPIVDHKHLLYGHTHFAFSGWVSLALSNAMIQTLLPAGPKPVYRWIFRLIQLGAFGMLLTFPFMGYKAPSIVFSTFSIFVTYAFAWVCWKETGKNSRGSATKPWFRAALLFNVISSAGPFYLAWLMAHKSLDQDWYIGSVYFYLHFQYNGFFLFGIIGLFLNWMQEKGGMAAGKELKWIFLLLFLSALPGFLLSALWMNLPPILYLLAFIAAMGQLVAFIGLLRWIRNSTISHPVNLLPATRRLWTLSLAALIIKFTLQSLSTVPSLGHFAFGYRPVIIGYLHLVLLGFVTLFLLGYFIQTGFFRMHRKISHTGLWLFVSGILLNEIVLMLQGAAAISENTLPAANYLLLGAALIMFTGLLSFFIGQSGKENPVAEIQV